MPTVPQKVDVPPSAMGVQPSFARNTLEFWRTMRIKDWPADPGHGIAAEPAWSLRHNLIYLVTYGVLLPFMVIGAICAIRNRHRVAMIITGAIVSYSLFRGFMTGDDRFRLTIGPLIILLAMYGVRELVRLRNVHAPEPGEVAGRA